ncbi:G2/M phase-specific E3 ubiquitin-protein ligase [Acropora cervicornis]|uniref:G2/M phase-specific E3 ubiquitin-protein ligase n=1 Tax=Acropora cervicornis TaxID=6130 RepID=A0AAD9QD40_ACRCE|nr:G2/M phase-specific E3 ubiquitin-protein ligase [Acropora cervicornis]
MKEMLNLYFFRLTSAVPLDNQYASILELMPGTSGEKCFSDSEEESSSGETHDDDYVLPNTSSVTKPAKEILNELAGNINADALAKFNIARNFIWEGTKRAVSRKAFSPANKISVKFTDDAGTSEGAIDWGGPMREFFTLILQYIHDSQLLCGPENIKFLSYNVKCLEDNDYFIAGLMLAMSLVHGGPAPHFLSPIMFQALISDQPVTVSLQDVYDHELRSLLESLQESETVEKAKRCLLQSNLSTVLDLAGTLGMPLKTLDDVKRMVATTAQWFVLGRCKPALEVFRDGLSALGVLGAAKEHPDSLRPLFCDLPEKLTAERMEELFQAKTSPAGSSKAVTESLVLSRWSDFLQDVEDEDIGITLSDILFFTTGCRVLPQREMPVTVEFLHELPSRFPTANTCSSILRLPVVHQAYESFKADLTFGILNA